MPPELTSRIADLFPSVSDAVAGALAGLVAAQVAGRLAVWRHVRGQVVGDSRKLFHFAIFSAAALLRVGSGIGAVMVFGAVVALHVLYATWRGAASPLFRALARPTDAPRERLHVLVPLAATAVGGVLAHLIAGPRGLVALLVGGWGDALGEPVGRRWGRHRYRVWSLGGVPAERSWEGTAAVAAASYCAAALGLALTGTNPSDALLQALPLAAAATVVESLSPHGLDNLTVLVVVAALCRGF